MNLYLLTQSANATYDCWTAAVVAASTIQDARNIHPDGVSKPKVVNGRPVFVDDLASWVDEPRDVAVKEIGKAAPGTKRGVVLASWKAD